MLGFCRNVSKDPLRLIMAEVVCFLTLVFLELQLATAGMDSCYNAQGLAQRCMPIFENAAFGKQVQVSNTCGTPPEDYCLQMGTRDSITPCHRCDAAEASLHHNATYLTDFHSQEEPTWWQSQSMAFGIQYPNSVNITLHLGKVVSQLLGSGLELLFHGGSIWYPATELNFSPKSISVPQMARKRKSYEITYVRLKFHTSRPESFAIYKRSHSEGPWIPYQYYSASCNKTYGKPERHFLRPGEDERVAFCTAEFSDISPLNGGNVAFSTLEGRPSAYSFDQSPVLQKWPWEASVYILLEKIMYSHQYMLDFPNREWVTGTDLLISLDRLNTFGDDIFKDPKVLQSYYYTISDFSVGGRCKCNGHANTCIPNEEDELTCLCQHNTTGLDCDSCQPFYQDRPWARGTAESANECLPCNCSGKSNECFYDWELYRRTGHGGHCQNCQDNTDGPHCERCRQNFYRWDARMACQPCNCNPAGSLSPQCDHSGACECKTTVTGWKCERCREGFHSLSEGGCRPCACDAAGSVGLCDPNTGHCTCKEKVEGHLCNRCQPGTFNLQPHNPAGCTSCFCFGHSVACTVASGYEVYNITSDFSQGLEGWRAETPEGLQVPLSWAEGEIFLEQGQWAAADFLAPEKFLQDQRLSYGQQISVLFRTHNSTSAAVPFPIWLVFEGDGIVVSARYASMEGQMNDMHQEERTVAFRLHETEKEMQPALSSFQFQRLLSNLTKLRIQTESSDRQGRLSLKAVQLTSARPGLSQPALWVEECICPPGYMGQFCESCAPNFKREIPFASPFTSCIPCSCNQHGSCDPNTGLCQCLHNTEGPSCERCAPGFHGDPFLGHSDDCKPCPCPGQAPCVVLPGSGEVVCTQCPPGQRGRLCELCDDGFFGDPLGRNGPIRSCSPCACNDNVDPNAVGNCDPVSGRCLRCLYNTAGERCERCKEGYYGDPLADSPARKCASCNCNPGGSIRGPEACHNVTGQCPCLPHVTGKDCSQCQEGYFALQAGIGCKSCKCHPTGSQHSHCHLLTGQCVCRSGVEGLSCDRCQAGFFGFSFQGCRACNCSRLGSVSLQCHENSTCLCKRGFVGYKCDQCEENYFLDPESSQCTECPICYSLVKEQADKLKDRLIMMEPWLQKPDCGRHKAHYTMLGEEPQGDSIHSHYWRKGAKATFLEEAEELESSVSRAWSQLRNISDVIGCSSSVGTKSCILLSDTLSLLQSTQQEIQLATEMLAAKEFPSEISHQPTNWSHQALASKLLARGHEEAAALVEDIARKALEMSNASYLLLQSILTDNTTLEFRKQMEARYQGILKVQQELSSEMQEAAAKKTFASIQQINLEMSKNLSWITILQLRPLLQQVENLIQNAKELEQLAESKSQQVMNGSLAVQAGLEESLQRMQQVEQLCQRANTAHLLSASSLSNGEAVVSEAKNLLSSLDGMKRHKSSLLKRRMAVVRERVIADAQKKARQAQRILGDSALISAKAQKTAQEVEALTKEGAKKVQAVFRDAKEENKRASQLLTSVDLTMVEIFRQEQESAALGSMQEGSGQVGLEVKDLDKSLRDAQSSLERDIEALNDLLLSLGNLDHTSQTEAALNANWVQLERLQLHLAEPGALGQKLSALQQEAEQQRQRIEAFEKDLEEIQSDRQNLEAILQSLPEQCSSWQ